MMPKGCTCRLVVDLWCRVHHPNNRVRVRLTVVAFDGLLASGMVSHGAWWDLPRVSPLQRDMTTFHMIARGRARDTNPDAYAAWERRQKALQ